MFLILSFKFKEKIKSMKRIGMVNPTRSYSVLDLHSILNRLLRSQKEESHREPHPGLILAKVDFNQPYPNCSDVSLLSLACMDLLLKFAYPALDGYGKFTISLTMRATSGDVAYTVGPAIPLTCSDGKVFPQGDVYGLILKSLAKIAEKYKGLEITSLLIRIYLECKKDKKDRAILSYSEIASTLSSLLEQEGNLEIEPRTARSMSSQKGWNPPLSNISKLKQLSTQMRPFIVADTETILNDDNVHQPYAAGLLLVRPGEDLSSKMECIETYFSEDYSIILDDFQDRSNKVLFDLIERISVIVRKEKSIRTIYFHNFARFDGIIVLKHLACHNKCYTIKPLMRNNTLYELVVYDGEKMLFRFRDSLHLLPGKLSDLAKNLCPDLGKKGSIEYEDVTLSNLPSQKKELLDYMKQDILLLGGVMLKAQEIYWKAYKVDIESKITLSSLALSIFRMSYHDATNWPIHIPSHNEDTFIRRGYYGGHADAYKPSGENLYYYDVNSLYPYIMKEFPMPGGVPVWHGSLEGKDLDSICGFIEAYVVCPKTIRKPFLPYRDKNDILIFPTGEFVGVYYSEELKYAKSLGYTVIPLSGYLFERMESPFSSFVSSLFESRLKAKKDGNEALSFVYKTLMNSLYGRFGINPKSTVTEVCSPDRYKHLLRNTDFIFAEMLSDKYYIVSYWSNPGDVSSLEYWNPPRIGAVQLAAAITASARIYMYPYISREDCYYTDTDSVVLGQPLSEEVISSSELGKFKLEKNVKRGYFLAPKSYLLIDAESEDDTVLKHKGPAKAFISKEWFESQYEDIDKIETVSVKSNFRIDWHKLNITKKETLVTLGIQVGTKRNVVFQGDTWVDTDPIDITELGGISNMGKILVKELRHQVLQLQDEKMNILSILSERERELAEKDMVILEKERSLPVSKKDTPKPESKWIKETEALKKEEQNPLSSTKGKGTGQTKPQKKPPT